MPWNPCSTGTRAPAALVRTLALVLLFCLAPGLVSGQAGRGTPAGLTAPSIRIAVLDLSGAALSMQTAALPGGGSNTTVALPPPPEFARGLTQMLTTALVERPGFVVLERAEVDKVLTEQDFTRSGLVTAQTSIGMGRVLGAQVLITGDITEFSYNQSSLGGGASILNKVSRQVNTKASRVTAQVAIDLRIVDAVTGVVVGSARGEGKASATGVEADLTLGDKELGLGGSAQTPLGQASRSAIEKAVDQLAKGLARVPWSGRVSSVRGQDVYINAGGSVGVVAGMEFDVFEAGEPVVDPATGEVLGAPETRMGRIRIGQVSDRFAVGRVVDGGGVKTNHIIRFVAAGSRR